MSTFRERTVFWVAIGALALFAALAYHVLLGPEPGAPPPPAAPVPAPLRLAVSRASGNVTIVRGPSRVRASPGDELRTDDAIETAPGARVELAGGGYEVQLEEGGRFDVEEITAELARFRLAAGLVSARVEPAGGRAVEIAASPDAVARTTGGDVSVSRSGDVIAVGVRRGAAEFRSGGRTVTVEGGQQSIATVGAMPSPPGPLPASLLLKVSWPEERTTNHRRIVVTGRAAPGAVVVVGDERVEVRPDGRFEHVIVLAEGRQRLSARAHGVAGSATADGPAIVLDTRAPDPRFDTRDLWSQPRR